MTTTSLERYGHFSQDGREFVITTPELPRPWINYLTNGEYCALCSHVGGGFSFYLDHRFNGILKRGLHQSQEDLPGRFIYIKDEDSGEVWNANVHPLGKYDSFTARHGTGYTIIQSGYSGIHAEIRYFVPQGNNAEMWTITLRNTSRQTRRLSVYTLAEFSLGNVSLYEMDTNFHGLFYDVETSPGVMVARHKFWIPDYGWSENNQPWQHKVFLTTTQVPDRMTTDRIAFFGPLRSFTNPAGVEADYLPAGSPGGKQLVGACQWRINLKRGASWSVSQAIGVQPDQDTAAGRRAITALAQPATYETAWVRNQKWWDRLFAGVQVETPDPDINRMANVWNKLQLMINFYFGRGPSYFHKGQYPAMRDSCQDAFGVIPLDPTLALSNLRRIGSFFFSDGQAAGGCNRINLPEGPSVKVDLPLWFILAVADYLRETGNLEFLNESLPLLDGGTSTVYEKMVRGIERMIRVRGAHGLPLMGHGDWNDAANQVGSQGRGESVWLAQFLCYAVDEIAPFMRAQGDTRKLAGYQRRTAELRCIINEECWDGEWFVRAFRDDGRPLGVKGEKEGFIWINSQTWAVIGRIAEPYRLQRCMDAVEEHLGTPYGLTNLGPAYTSYDPSVGLISGFRAGWKENAAVFSHASAFNVVARALLGRGNDAVDLYRRILPASKDIDQYMVEPYIYSQFCAGPGAGEEMGQGAYHWLTGTAAWMFRSLTDYIIGVRPQLNGLLIDPAVDAGWQTFSLRRKFRGSTYHIRFSNPDGVESGVRRITLDGSEITGNLLPLPTRPTHRVEVLMGAASQL